MLESITSGFQVVQDAAEQEVTYLKTLVLFEIRSHLSEMSKRWNLTGNIEPIRYAFRESLTTHAPEKNLATNERKLIQPGQEIRREKFIGISYGGALWAKLKSRTL